MFNFKNADRKIHNLELKNSKQEDRELSSEVFHYIESEKNCNQKSKLNQKAVDLTTNDTFDKEQHPNYEDLKAVESKAKTLFELEQIIVETEQF